MSLIAWYPLNGNLKDYSNNLPDITGSWTIDDFGKIGKCYKKNGNLTLPISSKQIGTSSTIMFWVYTDSTSTENGMLLGLDAPREFFTCFQFPTKNDFHWSSNYETGTMNYGGVDNGILKDNEWTHVTLVYNNRTLYRYYNGELKGTTKYDNDLGYSSGRNLMVKGLTGTKLNDIRIYNHALSTKEIKEAVKCEVLHLDFNTSIECSENVCVDRDTGGILNDGTTDTWEGHTSTRTYEVCETPLGNRNVGKCSIVYNAAASPNGGGARMAISLTNKEKVNPNTTYTVSYYLWSGDNLSHVERNMIYIRQYTSAESQISGQGIFNKANAINMGSGWWRVTGTFTTSSTTDYFHVNLYVYPRKNIVYKYFGMMIEGKDHYTDYTLGIRDKLTIGDSSGYNNHSKEIPINLCPTWVNDSILGSGCYKFNGNNKIETIPSFFATTNVSMSAWVKPTSRQTISDRDLICLLKESSSVYITITPQGNMSCYSYSVTPPGYHNTTEVLPLNEWSHLVATWDNTKLRMYINGQKVKEVAHTVNATPVISQCLNIGSDNSNRYYNGLLDDVKVFQTALSDDDILNMYNTRVSISDNNSLFINEIIENPNLFDVKTILNRQTELGINTSSKLIMYDNINALALSASSYYSSSIYHSIFPDNYFEPNTAYDFCITINGNLIHKGKEVPAGLRIRYSDDSKNDTFIVSTSGKWKQYYFRSDPSKIISKVEVYCYIGDLFYIDPSTSYIKKATNINVNNKSQITSHEFRETNYNPGLLDYSTWTLTSAPDWGINGSSDENARIIYGNPYNDLDLMWYVPLNDATSDGDGGFNSPKIPIDNTKTYRFSIWIRIENCGTGSGTTYFGLYSFNAAGTNTGVILVSNNTVDTNPYFKYIQATQELMENWVLFVSYVHPKTYTSTTHDPKSGIYDLNGNKFIGSLDYKWNTDTTQALLRSYLYYSIKIDEKQYFYRPRIDLCNGSEPSIETLLKCNEHLPLVNPNGEYYPKNIFSMYDNKKIITNQIFES